MKILGDSLGGRIEPFMKIKNITMSPSLPQLVYMTQFCNEKTQKLNGFKDMAYIN